MLSPFPTPKKVRTCFRRHFTIFLMILFWLIYLAAPRFMCTENLQSSPQRVGSSSWPRDQEPLHWERVRCVSLDHQEVQTSYNFYPLYIINKFTPFQFTSQWIWQIHIAMWTQFLSHDVEHFYHTKQVPWALLLGQFFLHGPWLMNVLFNEGNLISQPGFGPCVRRHNTGTTDFQFLGPRAN